jgi:hypothetical protein
VKKAERKKRLKDKLLNSSPEETEKLIDVLTTRKPKAEVPSVRVAPQAQVGRPTIRNPEIEAEILDRISKGESLRKICDDEHMPNFTTIYDWLAKDEGFAYHYARARDTQADHYVEETVEIADDGRNDWMEANGQDSVGWQLNGEHIQRSRLRIDTRKWIASKLRPKKYGDSIKVETETTIKSDTSVTDPKKLLTTAEYIITSCLDLPALEFLKDKLEEALARKRSEGAVIINQS